MNQQSIQNCQKTLQKLTEFLAIDERINEEYTHAAVIQAFEFTFEVFWKTFQKIGQAEGVTIGSPKAAFLFAYQSGLIENENIWLDLLHDRNMTTHTYHEVVAHQILKRIREHYLNAFQYAYQKLVG